MRTRAWWVMVAVGVAIAAGPAMAQSGGAGAPAKKSIPATSGPVTEGALAQWIVPVLGLSRFVPAEPSVQDCFGILMQNGIRPKLGWVTTNVVTPETCARILVQSMDRQGEIKNPDTDQEWLDLLAGMGIKFTTVGEAVDRMDPASEPVGNSSFIVSTDPLKKQTLVRPLDEELYGTDITSITRMFQVAEKIPPPPPPGPEPKPKPKPIPPPPPKPPEVTPC